MWNSPKTVPHPSIWVEALSYQKYQPITEYWEGTDKIWKPWWRKIMDEGHPPASSRRAHSSRTAARNS